MKWILFTAKRLASKRARHGSAVPVLFSISGLAFGVTVLIVILSVMNGLQQGFITALLELSSAHVRLTGTAAEITAAEQIGEKRAYTIFWETQALVAGNYDSRKACSIQAVPVDVYKKDAGLAHTLQLEKGNFEISAPNTAVIGYALANLLAVNIGDTISVLAASGSSTTDLFPKQAELQITGLFKSGFYEIDSMFCYISTDTGRKLLGEPPVLTAAVKFKKPENDVFYIEKIKKQYPSITAESWRSYNHSFFGALKIEKNLMLILITLIFVVAAVNIYNGMRRSIHEHREDIAVLTSLGAEKKHVQLIFIVHGAAVGLIGAGIGVLFGLLLSIYVNEIFSGLEAVVNVVLRVIALLRSINGSEQFKVFNPRYFYMEDIPIHINTIEIVYIFLFALFSAVFASYSAAKKLSSLKPAEVLRYE